MVALPLQGSVAVRFWNMLLSCWASWPFCKRVAASSAAVGAERTSVIKLPKTAMVKDSEYCIFLLVKKKSASSSGKMNGNSTRLKESESGEKEERKSVEVAIRKNSKRRGHFQER